MEATDSWKGKKVALKRINIPPGINSKMMIESSCELNALKYTGLLANRTINGLIVNN